MSCSVRVEAEDTWNGRVWDYGIRIDDIMCDDITCEDLHHASVAGMYDILCDYLTYDDLNPECEIIENNWWYNVWWCNMWWSTSCERGWDGWYNMWWSNIWWSKSGDELRYMERELIKEILSKIQYYGYRYGLVTSVLGI